MVPGVLDYITIYNRVFNVCVTVVTCNVLMLHLLHQLGFSHYTICYALNMVLYKYITPLPPNVTAIESTRRSQPPDQPSQKMNRESRKGTPNVENE